MTDCHSENTVGFINTHPDEDLPFLIEIVLGTEGYEFFSVNIDDLLRKGDTGIKELLEHAQTVILDLPARPDKTLQFFNKRIRPLNEAGGHRFIVLSDPIALREKQIFGVQVLERPFGINDLVGAIKKETRIRREREI